MALWSYLISDWDINKLTVNPNLSGDEAERAKKILAAAKDIYAQGTAWNDMKSPEVTCTPDRDTAYEVTIDGKQYKQQEFTVWSKTWVNNYAINIAFTDPASVPAGTRIVDKNNQDITSIKAEWMNNGHGGTFKVLYPVESIQGQAGSVQLSLNCEVYAYAVFFASCLEKDEYGNLQTSGGYRPYHNAELQRHQQLCGYAGERSSRYGLADPEVRDRDGDPTQRRPF